MERLTYQDAVDHVVDYVGGGLSDVVVRDAKKAVQAAYRDLFLAHNWTYLYKLGRIPTVVSYATGTIAYDSGTGVVTLTGGTWPTWAADGAIRVGELTFLVKARLSATTLSVDDLMKPPSSIAAGTKYTLYMDSYALPEDLVSQDQISQQGIFGSMSYVHPRSWLKPVVQRWETGDPRVYTILEDPLRRPSFRLFLWPIPDSVFTLDFVYKRRPRPLSIIRATAGTLAVNSGSATVTSSTAIFTQSMVGSVIRAYTGTTLQPGGGHVYALPPAYESVIDSVTSPTVAVCREASESTLSAAPYYVSDILDIDPQIMANAFWLGCEHRVSMLRVLKDKPSVRDAYRDDLEMAKSADSRSSAGRVASGGRTTVTRGRAVFDWSDPS